MLACYMRIHMYSGPIQRLTLLYMHICGGQLVCKATILWATYSRQRQGCLPWWISNVPTFLPPPPLWRREATFWQTINGQTNLYTYRYKQYKQLVIILMIQSRCPLELQSYRVTELQISSTYCTWELIHACTFNHGPHALWPVCIS